MTAGWDDDGAAGRLASWLETALPEAKDVEVRRLEPPTGSGGYSNLALIVDAEWGGETQELFARVELGGERLVPGASLEDEGRLIDRLGPTKIPVPGIVGYEPDSEVLGAPFLMMTRTRGRVMPDNPPFTAEGWVLKLSKDDQARYYDNGLQALASITTLDWQAAGLAFLRPNGTGTTSDERLAFAEQLLDASAKGREFPLIDEALAWLRAHQPAGDEPLALSWGDARPGNLMYAPDGPQVAAVLDWEQAVIGSRELDLGWWLFSNRIHSEGCGFPLPPGFPDRDATVQRFAELTGHEPAHLAFYEAYAGVYISTVMIGIADRLVAAGAVPEEAGMQANNPSSVVLATLLDLAAPAGAPTGWSS